MIHDLAIVERLPRTATNKIVRRALRARYAQTGVGVDFGSFTDAERLDEPEEGLGMFSVGLMYEFDADNPDLRPYVRGGLSSVFSELGGFRLMHVGGGVNWWAGERWGLKFDVRDHFFYDLHTLEFVFGVLFRAG